MPFWSRRCWCWCLWVLWCSNRTTRFSPGFYFLGLEPNGDWATSRYPESLVSETYFEAFLADLGFGPGKWFGVLIIGRDEGIDMGSQLCDRSKGGAGERLVGQDREPNLDLIEPGGARRREMKVDVGMAGEPAVGLRLMGVEVVEDDVNLPLGMRGHDAVHEVEELDAPAAPIVLGSHLAGSNVESSEQSRGAMPLVVMRVAGQRTAVGQLEIALRPFQRLDRGLLVHRQHQCTVGWIKVQPHDLGGFGGELRIVALAPGFAGRQIDLLDAQKAPDILHVNVAQFRCDQRTGPASVSRRHWPVEHRKNPFVGLGRVFGLGAAVAGLVQPGKTVARIAHPPLRCRSGRTTNFPADRAAGHAFRSQQHDLRPLAQPVFRLGRTRQLLKLGLLVCRQNNRGRFRDASHAPLESRLTL